MSRRHYDLPPLTTLSAFEAAARHLSFKNAAEELSVTPGAVSHQIKALEQELNTPLFRRKHRGVELTDEGETLFDTLATGFSKMSQTLQGIRDSKSADTVRIGSTSAVAALWLSPAVVRFWRSYPEINVNQIVQDRPFRPAPDMDLFIRYGRDRESRLDQTELYRDTLGPVASPDMARRLAGRDLAELAQERLIHLDAEDNRWTTWSDWFLQQGYDGPISPGVRVNNYSVALQVAQDGGGLALGWHKLLQPVMTSGLLAAVGPHVLPAPHKFYLVGRGEADLSPSAKRLKDWLLTELAL
jgi:DNA-binding transcriptional LysR family regulator